MQVLSADTVDAALVRVLARPEFAARESSGLLRLVSDLGKAFRQWIGSLLSAWVPEQWHPAFTWLIVVVVSLLALWALVTMVRALVGSPGRGDAAEPVQAAVGLPVEDAAAWEAAARAAAAAGRFRDAAIALYLAAVLRLEERGILRYHAGKTPGDYRAEARSHPASRGPFDTFIRQFLPIAFGARTPDAAAFQALRTTAVDLGVNG
jgi:hypothetical protein